MRFEKIFIEITNFCGLHCTFCTPQKDSKAQMSLELFSKITNAITPYTKLCALHILGDPLTLPNLNKYLNIAKHLKLDITTSGFFTKPLHTLLEYPNIHQINISLTSALYQKNPISIQQYLQPILEFCALHKIQKSEVFINLRLWNLDNAFNAPPCNLELYKILESFFSCKITTQKTKLSYKIHLIQAPFFSWADAKNPKTTEGFCYGGSKQLGILHNGIVVPCCFDAKGIVALGDLNTQSFKEILQSKRLIHLIEGFKNNKRVESFCQSCVYPSYKNNLKGR